MSHFQHKCNILQRWTRIGHYDSLEHDKISRGIITNKLQQFKEMDICHLIIHMESHNWKIPENVSRHPNSPWLHNCNNISRQCNFQNVTKGKFISWDLQPWHNLSCRIHVKANTSNMSHTTGIACHVSTTQMYIIQSMFSTSIFILQSQATHRTNFATPEERLQQLWTRKSLLTATWETASNTMNASP